VTAPLGFIESGKENNSSSVGNAICDTDKIGLTERLFVLVET
jgi:hypothetical protein